MQCVNHPDKEVQSFCQHCGKPICASCVRTTASGQIFCESCFASTGGGTNPGPIPPGQVPPFYAIPQPGPNPAAAAVLGLIPGVGAMYNGQLFKGLIHILVFAVLVSITDHHGIFGLFIAGWVLYQSFEAFHTAKARRDGMPVPDPFGLNEVGNWLNLGAANRASGIHPGSASVPGSNPAPPPAAGYAQTNPPPYGAPYASSWGSSTAGSAAGSGLGAGQGTAYGSGPIPVQPPYADPYVPPNPEPYAEVYPPDAIPPIPPVAPYNWRRREPIFAFVLIGLGIIFLLQSMGFVGHVMHYLWPLMLIGLGAWLIVRRVGYLQGGSK